MSRGGSPRARAAADQLHAAQRDAAAVLRTTAATYGYRHGYREPSPWLRQVLSRAVTPDGGPLTCGHLPSRGPQVVFLAAHRGRLECPACSGAATRAEAGSVEDRTCDVCRCLIPAGQVEVVAVAFGPVLVFAGHCRACREVAHGVRP